MEPSLAFLCPLLHGVKGSEEEAEPYFGSEVIRLGKIYWVD